MSQIRAKVDGKHARETVFGNTTGPRQPLLG